MVSSMSTKIIIYGTGTIAKLWLESDKSLKPSYFISSNPNEVSYLGIPVKNVNDISNYDQYICLISVTTTNEQTYRNTRNLLFGEDLISKLRALGFSKVYTLEDSSRIYFPNFLKQRNANVAFPWTSDREFKTAREYDFENSKKLNLLRDRLVDNSSRELLDKIIQFRHTLDFIDYPRPQTSGKQYLESTFIDLIDKIIMLDLGSYDGDSAEDLINCFEHKTERIYCVEPSYENLSILRNFRNSHQKFRDRIVPVLCALGDKNEFANLSGSGSATSLDKLDLQLAMDSKSMAVPVCTLDSFFTDMGINLIKMDIEGYELNVIKGAKKYLRESSPFMAIAIYHKPTDLYTIPNEILEINQDYTFMLRLYSECLRELVLYCIPKSS